MRGVVFKHVLLLQRDVPAAVNFYAGALGLAVTSCTDTFAQLSCSSGALRLHLKQSDR